jgi:hypothetical protein
VLASAMRGPTFIAFLLVAAVLVPASLGQPEGDPAWHVDDARGDVAVTSTAPSPALLSRHVDLVRFAIDDEDEVGFYLSFYVDQIKTGYGVGPFGFGTSFEASFQVEGAAARYYVYASIATSTEADADGTFYVLPDAYYHSAELAICGEGFWCRWLPLPVTVDEARNAFHIWVPKGSLMGHGLGGGGPVPGVPSTIRPGQQLRELRAFSYQYLLVTSARDRVPDLEAAPPYAFAKPTANTVVRMELPGAAPYDPWSGDSDPTPRLDMQPGVNQTVAFTLTNLAAAKRLIKMEYRIVGPAEQVARYKVWGPETLTLPGNESRDFHLAVDVAATASATDDVRLVARGVSLGRTDEIAYASARLAPGLVLTHENPILYAHSAPSFMASAGTLGEAACVAKFVMFECTRGFLSPHESDPAAHNGANIQGYGSPSSGGTQYQYFRLSLPRTLSLPLVFDVAKPLEVQFRFTSPVNADGVRIQATMQYSSPDGGGVLFEGSTTSNLAAGGTTVTLSGPPRLSGKAVIPAGALLDLRVRTTNVLSPTGTAAWAAGGYELVPVQTRITLPLLPVPEDLLGRATPNPFQLKPVSSAEDFVNPGKGRLFNVSLLNQGSSEHRAQITAGVNAPGWTTEVRPGSAYKLGAGDVVTFGVLVKAPAEAREGDAATIRVNVTDEAGETVGIRLGVIATSGIDLPDDSLLEAGDEEARAKVQRDRGSNTPGPEPLVIVLGAVAAAWAARRRKP